MTKFIFYSIKIFSFLKNEKKLLHKLEYFGLSQKDGIAWFQKSWFCIANILVNINLFQKWISTFKLTVKPNVKLLWTYYQGKTYHFMGGIAVVIFKKLYYITHLKLPTILNYFRCRYAIWHWMWQNNSIFGTNVGLSTRYISSHGPQLGTAIFQNFHYESHI